MAGTSCDVCGKVYNEFLGDRFWSGSFTVTVDGETWTAGTLCDSCHRQHVRSV